MEHRSVTVDHQRSDISHPFTSQQETVEIRNAVETKIRMGGNRGDNDDRIIPQRHRFPHSIVWTPIPCISWLLPFVGHMGIALSSGVIRDFAGSYFVSEDDMAFGWPTLYWQLSLEKVPGGAIAWDKAILEASEEYKQHTHNLFIDNCHSHVALALNTMNYAESRRWNMIKLAFCMLIKGRYVGLGGFLKQWLPFLIIVTLIVIVVVVLPILTYR